MSASNAPGLLAVDVGSSRVKLGWYPSQSASEFFQPEDTFAFLHLEATREDCAAKIGDWLDQLPTQKFRCYLASVHREAAESVLRALASRGSGEPHTLKAAELPIEVRVDQPDMVGIDRLLAAVAANRWRSPQKPAIVVSLGTACTVNLIAADGAFEGGAIFPGIAMSAKALHTSTSTLPHLSPKEIDAPADAIGKSTRAAISSGLIWGAVGVVRELIDRMTRRLDHPPQLFITGGEAPRLAAILATPDAPAHHVPNMVLAGIRIAAEELL